MEDRMEYTIDRVRALASQARISLDPEEERSLGRSLGAMRALADRLDDGSAALRADPFLDAIPLSALREDVCGEDAGIDVADFAPRCRERQVLVPRAVEEDA